MTSAPAPGHRAANQNGPRRDHGNQRVHADHSEFGDHDDHGDHHQAGADGNDRGGDGHDVRGRRRHVNRNRSGQSSPRDSRRHRDGAARHGGSGTEGGDRRGSRHHDGGRHSGGAAPEGNRDNNRDGGPDSDVLDQIGRLRAEGGTWRSIAAAAGLAPATVCGLASGRRNPTPNTARAIGTVTGTSLRRARVDAGGTRLRLRALHVMGHGSARIARALGVREMTVRGIVRGDAATVSLSLRDAVAGLYDAWWDKRAPAGNWCAGAGLDDDELDTPGYRPESNWKPATGTGTAPAIHPPAAPAKTAGTPGRQRRSRQ